MLLVVCVIYTYLFFLYGSVGQYNSDYLHMTVRDWEYDALRFENMFTTVSMFASITRVCGDVYYCPFDAHG
jgi:hypothetical protein